MWKAFKRATGTKKGKAAVIAAFFAALSAAMPFLEPYLPNWAINLIGFLARFTVAFLGGL